MAREKTAVWTALGASAGTLICCALPALFVFLGFGGAVAAVISSAPWLVVLSRYKLWVFLASGAMIVGSRLYVLYITPSMAPEGASCSRTLGRVTNTAWWAALAVWTMGFFVAFMLGPMLIWRDG